VAEKLPCWTSHHGGTAELLRCRLSRPAVAERVNQMKIMLKMRGKKVFVRVQVFCFALQLSVALL
jgi:hypothetical protein